MMEVTLLIQRMSDEDIMGWCYKGHKKFWSVAWGCTGLKWAEEVQATSCMQLTWKLVAKTVYVHVYLWRCSLAVDPRVRPLVMFVKHWAKFQNINDASQGTVSSYSLSLMVIHYLQCKFFTSVASSSHRLWPSCQTKTVNLSLHLCVDFRQPALRLTSVRWVLVFCRHAILLDNSPPRPTQPSHLSDVWCQWKPSLLAGRGWQVGSCISNYYLLKEYTGVKLLKEFSVSGWSMQWFYLLMKKTERCKGTRERHTLNTFFNENMDVIGDLMLILEDVSYIWNSMWIFFWITTIHPTSVGCVMYKDLWSELMNCTS